MPSRQISTNTWMNTDRPATACEKAPTCAHGDELEMLGYDEVASILRISPRTLRRQVSSGGFPKPIKIGRRPVWRRQRVLEFLCHAQTEAENDKKKRGC